MIITKAAKAVKRKLNTKEEGWNGKDSSTGLAKRIYIE